MNEKIEDSKKAKAEAESEGSSRSPGLDRELGEQANLPQEKENKKSNEQTQPKLSPDKD